MDTGLADIQAKIDETNKVVGFTFVYLLSVVDFKPIPCIDKCSGEGDFSDNLHNLQYS